MLFLDCFLPRQDTKEDSLPHACEMSKTTCCRAAKRQMFSKLAEVGGRAGCDPPKRIGARVPVASGHLKNAGREGQGLVAGILPLAESALTGQDEDTPAVAFTHCMGL